MKLEFADNFDEVINDLKEQMSNILGTKPLGEILTDQFVSSNSSFKTLDEFADKSGFDFSTQESFEAIPEDELDVFVAANTSFESWKSMLETAYQEYIDSLFN